MTSLQQGFVSAKKKKNNKRKYNEFFMRYEKKYANLIAVVLIQLEMFSLSTWLRVGVAFE